jgi:hypothetical protein
MAKTDGVYPRVAGGSPMARPISRWAMANRVTESIMSITFLPWSRYDSAIAVAVNAARSRKGAEVSEVATTTTERFIPSGPRSFSMNSRTSRPRSPTRPTTTTSAEQPRAIIPSSVDLPTPDPAKRPMRWPRPMGVKASRARTPVARGSRILWRRSGCGGLELCSMRSTGIMPSPSKGLPRASKTRPNSSGPVRGRSGLSSAATSQPTCKPEVSPSGMRRTRCSRNPTTSARTEKSVRGERTMQRSPSPTLGPSESMMSPATPVTAPTRWTAGMCRTLVRRTSMVEARESVTA